jgi:hypothetical protein
VKPVAASAGAAVTTRLRTSKTEDEVLDEVAALLGSLRRADLAAIARPVAGGDRKADVNARKTAITARSSSRWAGTIIRGSADQYKLARRALSAHIASLAAAVTVIEARLAAPTADTLTAAQRKARRRSGQGQGVPPHRRRHPDLGVQEPAVRDDHPARHLPVRGQPRLHIRMGRPALAGPLQRHPARGSRHRDRATRPGTPGPATGRRDTRPASGRDSESCQPGPAGNPCGARQPTPGREAGTRIPPAPPGPNAATAPGNRYPGTADQKRPTQNVTVVFCDAQAHDNGWMHPFDIAGRVRVLGVDLQGPGNVSSVPDSVMT